MRLPKLAVFLLAAAAIPAAAQQPRLGERTRAPETMVPSLDPAADDLAQQVAEAETHPLGTLANPIRVGGPEGERAYLARLRCPDGAAPRTVSRGDGGPDTYGTVTIVYRLDCAGTQSQLFFDLYHEEHVEDRAPAGLTIAPR